MQIDSPTAQDWLCPDLSAHWRLRQNRVANCWILQGRETPRQIRFDPMEGYALARFSGGWTVAQIQAQCEAEFGTDVPPDLVVTVLTKLVQLGILAPEGETGPEPAAPQSLGLKPGVRWVHQADGHWILGDAEGLRHLQVSPGDKVIIEQIGHLPLAAIAHQHHCTPHHLRSLLNLLAQAQMLTGVETPPPPRRKFTPIQLLYFKKSLLNPDRWLERHVGKLGWLWRQSTGLLLCGFLALTAVMANAHRPDLLFFGQGLLHAYGWTLLLPFGLLAMAVVSLHELAHAFTLKHFGGAVSDMGLLFMCLIPAAYTNSSDAYRLRQGQQVLVIGAGVLCQVVIGAIAFWLWFGTAASAGLHTLAYLLMVAALFTVALNLNPMARFDGYYLLSAATGIRNLKPRSFLFYAALLRRQPSPEQGRDGQRPARGHRAILATYAPLSFLYLLLVFGKLFLWLANVILTHIPYVALVLFVLWCLYYFSPHDNLP
ncbi:peptidase M50 [Leptolyngbya sp. PCC 6406]|uniref:peptidase M50 n=1 Tax=Leptolyngbya sp. PCC 6406 TaxID=1173264 RepID=UPI0002AC07EA|nr:peptidase M50 [Leptolyngbya sp. PCC 6406]